MRLASWVQTYCAGDSLGLDYMTLHVATRLRIYRTWAMFWRHVQVTNWLMIASLGLLITVFAG